MGKDMNINIIDLREAPRYCESLANWHHQEWSFLNPDYGIDQRIQDMKKFLGESFVPSTFVGEYSGQLAGSCAIVKNDMDTHPELSPWLASVYVSPEFRNKGIGSFLVQNLVECSKNEGIKKMYLFTPDKESFYTKLGWVTKGKENYRNQEVTIMEIELV